MYKYSYILSSTSLFRGFGYEDGNADGDDDDDDDYCGGDEEDDDDDAGLQ